MAACTVTAAIWHSSPRTKTRCAPCCAWSTGHTFGTSVRRANSEGGPFEAVQLRRALPLAADGRAYATEEPRAGRDRRPRRASDDTRTWASRRRRKCLHADPPSDIEDVQELQVRA